MTLSTKVLLGLALGAATGGFFGEGAAFLDVVGKAFVLLLQMTVIPYLSLSLVASLGRLRYDQARQLAGRAGVILLLFYGLAFALILLLPLTYPDWKAASFFSSSLVEPDDGISFLELYIPSNPFHSLAASLVPGVVLFSVVLGIALIGIERKQLLLEVLTTLTDALMKVTGFVVRLAPVGVFAISANATGTMDLAALAGLRVYLWGLVALALLLSLWLLPGLVTALTPLRYREVLGISRGALVTAFATGSVYVVLPLLVEISKKLLEPHIAPELREESQRLVEVVVPVSVNFPSVGKLLGLSFVLFAGWLSGFPLEIAEYPAFVVTGLFTFFDTTVGAIPFLLDLFRVPSDTFELFIVADNIVGNRFGVLVAAVHILTLTLLSVSAMTNGLRIRWPALLRYLALSVGLTLVTLGGVRLMFASMSYEYQGYRSLISMQRVFEGEPAQVVEQIPDPLPPPPPGAGTLDRIRARGLLRVSYVRDRLPFAFRNANGELVGFDVELAHVLASELGVELEFVEVGIDDIPRLLDAGYLDVGISNLMITTRRMEQVSFSTPYLEETLAFIVRDHRRGDFNSRAAAQALEAPRIGLLHSPYYKEKLGRYLPQAKIVALDSPREFFTGNEEELDALLYLAEAGSAWTLVYPAFTVAVPRPDVITVPVACAVARGEEEMVIFLSQWIGLKKRDGTIKDLYDYWILGRPPQEQSRRWSVVRDVLGWVD
ncbi:MAG: cation:dicarboxylase symporter family transporter [Deltaproteobacteria bacterium]|nr:cation:dicarboxylase symporter family transporter [Deltaproteobacteria bacterium]